MIRWTTEEWHAIADKAYQMRLHHPEMSLIEVVNRIQGQMPESRRRKIRVASEIGPVLASVRKWSLAAGESEAEIRQLKQRIEDLRKRPDRETILSTLSRDEMLARYGKSLTSILAHALLEILSNHLAHGLAEPANGEQHGRNGVQNGALNWAAPQPPAPQAEKDKPRIAFFAVLDRQQEKIRQEIEPVARCIFIDKARIGNKILPVSVDYAVVWTKFPNPSYAEAVRRKLRPDHILTHRGGIKTLCEAVRRMIA